MLCLKTNENIILFETNNFFIKNNSFKNLFKNEKKLSNKIITKVELVYKNNNILILNNYKKYDFNKNKHINKLKYLLLYENIDFKNITSISVSYFENNIQKYDIDINDELLDKNFVNILDF